MADSYHSERDTQNVLQLRAILKDFPPFARQYFLAQEASKETRTRLSYAYDIRTFFRFLQENNPVFAAKDIHLWTVDMLDLLEASDIEEYQDFGLFGLFGRRALISLHFASSCASSADPSGAVC